MELLWSCELYHEAENLATVAARSCPDSVDLQHALFVSQLVNTERTPEADLPVAASSYDFSVSAFPYPLVNIEESDFGIEIGLGSDVVTSESEQPKACVKGGSKRRCHAHVKPPCVKSCEDMPCGGIVRCQHVECGALAGGLIGTGVGALTGNGLGTLISAIAARQNACCEAKSCCARRRSCAGCTKSCKDGCCCKPNACECEKNCSCGKDASCNTKSCCTPPCCGTSNGCCAMGHKDEPFTIGRIVIVGNHTTQDRVIRRVLDLHPGQVVKASELTRAEQSLARLGLFETTCGADPTIIAVSTAECPSFGYGISFKPHARPRTKDLVVTVSECQTGSLMLGGCINSNNGIYGSIVLNEKNYQCLADAKKSECACGKDCCCAKKCACGKDCACGGKTVSHCPWLELLHRHPCAAMHILHAPLLPPFVHGMMPPPPHMPVGCMPMPSPVMPPLPPPHMPVGCMPMPGMGFPPHVMMPPCPGPAPFAAVVSPNGQFMRWQMACPGMQAEQCVPAPVSVPAVAAHMPNLEQLPMPREVGVIPGTPLATSSSFDASPASQCRRVRRWRRCCITTSVCRPSPTKRPITRSASTPSRTASTCRTASSMCADTPPWATTTASCSKVTCTSKFAVSTCRLASKRNAWR